MAMVDTGDVRLHVQRLGPGDGRPAVATVVLVHGVLIDSLASYYFTLAPAFAAAGLDVVMYDHRGHGRSERPRSGYTLEDAVGDLDRLLDRLEVAGPVHLVGNSYGGTVCFGYAAHRPERVASVSVIEAEPATGVWAGKMGEVLDRLRNEMNADEDAALEWIRFHYGARTARLAKLAVRRLVHTTTITWDVPASRVLSEDQIRSIGCPVLGIYGSESALADLAPWLESLLPRCRTVIVPGHEHSVLVEAPDRVRELVLGWLLEHATPHGAHEQGFARQRSARHVAVADRPRVLGPAPLAEADAR